MAARGKKAVRQAEFAWDRAVYEAYRELRAQLRSDPNLPESFDAVNELAKMSVILPEGSPLRFLVLKEVASYTHPRSNFGEFLPSMPANRRALPPPAAADGVGPDLSRFVRKAGVA